MKLTSKSIILIGLLVLAVFAGSLFSGSVNGATENIMPISSPITQRTITANGLGAVKVTPDVAYVNIGVISEGEAMSKVQQDATTKMNNIIKELKKLEIKEEDIKTISYNVSPKYNWNEKTRENYIVGYIVSNTIEVAIKDIDKSGIVLDKVVTLGSNNVNGLRFSVLDETELYNQALELAVKDAKAKAEAMGKGLGIKNIQPIKISETGYRTQPMYDMIGKSASMDMLNAEVPTISTGEMSISASVTVEFGY